MSNNTCICTSRNQWLFFHRVLDHVRSWIAWYFSKPPKKTHGKKGDRKTYIQIPGSELVAEHQ